MQKSRSLRSFRTEEEDRRYSPRRRHDEYGDSKESNLVRTPPSRRWESGNAGATEARKYPNENYVRSSAQPSTNDGRRLSPMSAKYRDGFRRRRSSDPHQDFSAVRGRNYWSKPEVSDRRSSLRSRRLDEYARQGERPRESNAGTRANTYHPNEVRATQDAPPRRRSWMPDDRFPSKGSTISPSGGDKKSRMLGDYGSKYVKRDDDATRSSRRDLSPPRKTPSMTSRVRGDIERRIDVRDGRWSPDAPPYYSSPPRRISSKTRPGHDDYESRSYRRRSEHSPSPSHKASRTSRAYSDIQLSSTRWSGARRTDSPTGGSSPRWQSASKCSRLYDGNKPRAYYTRSEDDSPDSPHDRPIHPPRTYSQTSRVRGDIEPSNDRRSGTRKMYSSLHSPSLLRSVYSEAYNMPGASTRKHSRREDGGSLDSWLDRSISPRRSGRADEDSRDDWWSGHRLDSAHERSIFLQRTPETYRVRGGLETATAQKIGERRTDRPVELGSPPKGKAFKTAAAIGNYKSGANLRQPPESSSEPAPPKDTSKEVKTRAYSEPSAIRQSDVPKASSPLHRINISKMVSSKATSGHTKSEPEKEGRSGSFRPSSQSDHTDPPKRKPSSKASAPQGDTDPNAVRRTRDPKSTATEGTTLSTRKESASRGDTRTDVPLDFKPVSNVDKSSGKVDAGASGRRPGDTATTGNAAEPNKTAKDAPADADAAHRKYSYVPLEETEEIQIPKAPETPPSEEYIPPSQVGHAATKVDESLGPFSDDDDDDGVNFDWDRPNDECDSERNGLLLLLKEFSDVGDRVLVTIAPDADIVKKHYPLLTVPLPQVEYVIVATHRLRAEGVVSCSGGQIEAALAYWAIRKLLEPVFTEKVIYSTAFGGDVYFSKTTRLLSYGTPLSPFHGLTQGIPKISYTDICKLTPVNVTDDCSLYLLERNDSGYKVVPFVGVREMWNRQTTAEGFQMSRIPIVVYDIHLDDYGLACDGYPWPLTRTLSEPVTPKLRPFG